MPKNNIINKSKNNKQTLSLTKKPLTKNIVDTGILLPESGRLWILSYQCLNITNIPKTQYMNM